jgi:DNA topoisomerase VI subunit B
MAKFAVRARAVDMLGRQQIAGIPTAIHELFKNAHDAYATRVEVDYLRDLNRLVVRDNGLGMTEAGLASEKWRVPNEG